MNVFNKYTRAKFYYRFMKLFEKKAPNKTDKTQDYVMKIASSIISDPETEFIESHVESIIYMHWQHITIKIFYEDCKVVMMNGKYFYYFTMNSKDVAKLRTRIYRVMDFRAQKWENKFTNDTINNLQIILNEVQHKDKYTK